MEDKTKQKFKKALGVEEGDKYGSDVTKMPVTGKIDYSYLYAIIENLPVEQMNVLEICQAVYDRIIVRFAGEYHEERDLRIKYENTIIDKVRKIDQLEKKLVRAGALIPEESKEAFAKL